MLKKTAIGLYVLFCVGALYAQVNEAELSGVPPVSFLNYEGPHSRIDTLAQIRDIGYTLGVTIPRGAKTAGARNRYFVIHSVTDPEGDKLDADIFGLGSDVGVDHIRNLRVIIQGYLEGAYAYKASDANLLARYITTYNAVYRGNMSYFNTRYKTPVTNNLTREQVGLSIRYDEWPGKSLMLIPLITGSIGPVDTSTISDENVVNEMRREEDMGIEQRKEMVDLKEREAAEAEKQAAEKRDEIAAEEARIAEERQDIAAEQDSIAQERVQSGQDGSESDQDGNEQALQEREDALAEKEDALAKQEEGIEEKKGEAEQLEQFAEEKAKDAESDRADIARDQQEQNTPGAANAAGVAAVALANSSNPLGYIAKIDPLTGTELKRSTMDSVNARTLTVYDKRVFALAGQNRAIRLIEIDPETLMMIKQNDDDIAAESLLWLHGTDFYAIVASNNSYYIARYDTDLKHQAQSVIAVSPFATVNIQGNVLLVQRPDGRLAVLGIKDLAEL